MRTQGSDPTHSPGDLLSQWFRSWGSWWKSKVLRIIILIWHVPILFYGLCFQCNRVAAKCASSVLMKPLADHLGHTAEQGDAQIVRAGHLGEMSEEAIKGTWLLVDPCTGPRHSEAPRFLPCPWNVHSSHHSHSEALFKATPWGSTVLLRLSGRYM